MAACYAPTTFRCDMCRTDFSCPLLMAFHVLTVEKHRRRLSHVAPEQVKELARLPYFLDTHMKEEPILGLEYIVEEQLGPEKYKYTCQLCQEEGKPYMAFLHIMSKEHMQRYIEKHHPSLLVNNSSQPIAALSLRELRDKALTIQNQYGRNEINVCAGNSPAEQEQASPEQKQASPILVNQKLRHKCLICNACFQSALNLCQHVVGKRHQMRLGKVAPGDVKKQARMQYILDTYVKEEPVVGLEYVVERQESESYRYFCTLCGFDGGLLHSLIHVLGYEHKECYIRKHYSWMLPKVLPSKAKHVCARYIDESAFTIVQTYGCTNVQTEDRFVDPSLMEPARPPPKEEVRPSPPKNVSEKSGPFLHNEELDSCRPCRLCNVVFSSPVDLWNHVVGSKHKEILSKTSPQELKELGRLQYFLNNHMKKDPLLGLEYIVEEQLGSTSYKYTCQLCNVEGYLPLMITHITCVDHIERYIDKHYSDLSLRVYTYPERADYIKALTIIARIILDKCGRQDIVLGPVHTEKRRQKRKRMRF